MTNRITADATISETSLEAQGLEVVVAAATTETAATDDVFIDGRIITAENYDAAAGQDGSDLLIVNNGDGSDFLEGGESFDFVQVNGADGSADGGLGGSGNDVLIGDRGNDFSPGEDVSDVTAESADSFAFVDQDAASADADSVDPVLMVISNQDFWYQDYADTRQDDVQPMEDLAMNYEEIKLDSDSGFDAVFDAM